jgi:hypothetical protein
VPPDAIHYISCAPSIYRRRRVKLTDQLLQYLREADKKDVTLSTGVNQACDSLDICPCASAPLIPYYTVKSTQREGSRRMAARFFSAKRESPARRQPRWDLAAADEEES